MTTTDRQLLNQMQYLLLETANDGASLDSDQWTIADWADALDEAQNELMKLVDVHLSDAEIPTIPRVTRHPLPDSTIGVKQVAWRDSSTVAYWPLQPDDFFSADAYSPDWETTPAARPRYYLLDEIQQLLIGTIPPAKTSGVLNITHTRLGHRLSNTGIPLLVPDELAVPIKWRAVEILLRRLGHTADVARADYCRQRWEEGILATRVMLDGGL